MGTLFGLPFALKLGGWLGRGGAGRLGLMDGLLGTAPSDDFSRLSSFFVSGVEGGSNSTETVAGGGGGGPAGLACCGSEWSCFFLRGGFTGGELLSLALGRGGFSGCSTTVKSSCLGSTSFATFEAVLKSDFASRLEPFFNTGGLGLGGRPFDFLSTSVVV